MNFCRSGALGSRTYRCDSCNYETTVFNSCGDRHCPNCSGAKRRNWMEGSTKLVVDDVTYFQLVFTLPEQLSSLALGNRKLMYGLLFQAAWDALKAKVERELGIQAAAMAVLHTWNQELGHHPHIHMMVAGNGLSLDGQQWIKCRLTKDGKPFLVDNTELGHDFRDRYLSYLRRAEQAGQLNLDDSCFMADLMDDLSLIDWNVFIQGPPKPGCPPEHMLRYLTRYMTGGPISDKRIIGEKSGNIWFHIRRRDKQAGQQPFKLPAVEFVRRWTIHILPKDFTKVRHFGCWTCAKRSKYLKACQALLTQRSKDQQMHDCVEAERAELDRAELSGGDEIILPVEIEPLQHGQHSQGSQLRLTSDITGNDEQSESSSGSEAAIEKTSEKQNGKSRSKRCPTCQAEMRCIAEQTRPSWSELFYGPEHPWWFEWTSLGKRPPSIPPTANDITTRVTESMPIDGAPGCKDSSDATDQTMDQEQDIFEQVIAMRQEIQQHSIVAQST